MEIDKTLVLQAPPQQVWALLLDPQAMGACVPGMESIEVVSADEYVALMRVKMAFISARFKLRTRIVERREPHFLLAEGTGEDASVASSLKQRTEMHLEPRADNGTDLRLKVQVDLLGRMGTFGLSAMKTKADRLWDEFGINLAARLAGTEAAAAAQAGIVAPIAPVVAPATAPAVAAAPDTVSASTPAASPATGLPRVTPASAPASAPGPMPLGGAPQGWWPSLLRSIGVQPANAALAAGMIVVEVRRPDQTLIRVEWPASKSDECARWLCDAMR